MDNIALKMFTSLNLLTLYFLNRFKGEKYE